MQASKAWTYLSGKKFDIITMLNVLEHLADPVLALRQIKKLINKDGILVIDVPNDFNDFQTTGRNIHRFKRLVGSTAKSS